MSASTLMLASAGVSALGSIAQGQAARKQAKFQSAVLRQQSAREREIAAAEEEDFRRAQSRKFAQGRAEMGGAGIDPSTGTPLLTAGDFAAETELNALRIRSGGETAAFRAEQEARLLRSAGRSAARQSFVRAGASLLGGVAQAKALK